jgi:hypothetical protein
VFAVENVVCVMLQSSLRIFIYVAVLSMASCYPSLYVDSTKLGACNNTLLALDGCGFTARECLQAPMLVSPCPHCWQHITTGSTELTC